MTRTGFEALRAACERLLIPADFGPPRADAPESVLGRPLEPALRALYREHDGVWWSAPGFSLRVYPLDGPDALEWRNEGLRRSGADYAPPYPFDDLLAFAQYGRQASYLATVPALADGSGRQPVLYLDTNEDPWAVPVASSVDAAFALLSRYLDRSTARLGLAGLDEAGFPFDALELVAADAPLRGKAASGGFDAWTRGDPSVREWVRSLTERA